MYQTLETVFHRLPKQLEFRQKYSAACRIFNSLRPDETLSLVFDILPPAAKVEQKTPKVLK